MNEILAVTLHAMQADAARLAQAGANLANVSTTAYRRGVAMQAPRHSFAEYLRSTDAPQSPAGAAAMQSATDRRPGSLKATGQRLDLALAGPGYFEISTGSGPAYTRAGSFHLDARGRLVTAQGDPVLGAGGEITLPGPDCVIDAAGAIHGGAPDGASVELGRLKVVGFDVPPQQPAAGGLLQGGRGSRVLDAAESQVRQGFLENSNVDPAREMTELVQALRHFESMQKIAQSYDDLVGSAIRRLSES